MPEYETKPLRYQEGKKFAILRARKSGKKKKKKTHNTEIHNSRLIIDTYDIALKGVLDQGFSEANNLQFTRTERDRRMHAYVLNI